MRSCHAGIGPRLTRYGTLVGSLAWAAGAAGQAVPTPLPERAPRLAELPTLGRSQLGTAPVVAPFPLPLEDPFRWGPVHVRPHVTYRYSASSGLQARPGQSSDSAIQDVSPGVLLELGDRWRMDYADLAAPP